MARKIRMPLNMPNGSKARTIEELRENFDLNTVLGYYADGTLTEWLEMRYYDVEVSKIKELNSKNAGFPFELCNVLGVELAVSDENAEFDEEYLNRRSKKLSMIKQITDDADMINNVDSVAFNQEDLLDALDLGKKSIYLVQGDFTVPLSVADITYIGIDNPSVVIRAVDNVNFKEKNIEFRNCYYGWDVSGVTPKDMLYYAETLIKKGEKEEAKALLKEVTDTTGNPRAKYLAYKYFCIYDLSELGNDVFVAVEKKIDNEVLIRTLERMNCKNDSQTQFQLGKCYAFVVSNSVDLVKAVELYTMSAKQGNPFAQCNLGLCYSKGNGVVQNYDEAIRWEKQAAEQGNRIAQCNLGIWYYNGEGVKQDYEKAVEWYRKSAEQEFSNAQCDLGNCYFYGNGVSQDYDEALKWYKKAGDAEKIEDKAKELDKLEKYKISLSFRYAAVEVDSESNISLSNIGWHYYYGYGVDIDYKKAFEYFEKAYIVKKDGWVCNKLGECYEYGRGVATNIGKAKDYYKQGSDLGSEDAKKSYERLR